MSLNIFNTLRQWWVDSHLQENSPKEKKKLLFKFLFSIDFDKKKMNVQTENQNEFLGENLFSFWNTEGRILRSGMKRRLGS